MKSKQFETKNVAETWYITDSKIKTVMCENLVFTEHENDYLFCFELYEKMVLETMNGQFKKQKNRVWQKVNCKIRYPRKKVHVCEHCNSKTMILRHSTMSDFTALTGLKDYVLRETMVPTKNKFGETIYNDDYEIVYEQKIVLVPFVLCHNCFYGFCNGTLNNNELKAYEL